LLVSGHNLGGFWLKPILNLETVFAIQYIRILHFVCLCPHFLSHFPL
jgi:hypothetical protein